MNMLWQWTSLSHLSSLPPTVIQHTLKKKRMYTHTHSISPISLNVRERCPPWTTHASHPCFLTQLIALECKQKHLFAFIKQSPSPFAPLPWIHPFALCEWFTQYFSEHASYGAQKASSISDLCYCLKLLHTRGQREVKIKPAGILPEVSRKTESLKSQTEAILSCWSSMHADFVFSRLAFQYSQVTHSCCMYFWSVMMGLI